MKFAIITERKNPPDRRVVFSPETLLKAKQQFPEAEFMVERSGIRIFPDEAYQKLGFEVLEDVSLADVMIGVKEVPISALIPNKSYFFLVIPLKNNPITEICFSAF